MRSLGVMGEPSQDQVTVGRGTPVASQVSVRAPCRGTLTLVIDPDPWMNSGGTGDAEKDERPFAKQLLRQQRSKANRVNPACSHTPDHEHHLKLTTLKALWDR